jgi:hypothetical protein
MRRPRVDENIRGRAPMSGRRTSGERVDVWAGPPDPQEHAALLAQALRLYDALGAMIGEALAAPPAEQRRLAVRVVTKCAALDDVLAAAGVAPVKDRRKTTDRSTR